MDIKTFYFKLRFFKPSGKWSHDVETHFNVRFQVTKDDDEYVYMPDIVEAIKKEYECHSNAGYSIYTDHDLGYPVLVKIL